MGDKEKYIKLCHSNTDIPLFLRSYYLDAVGSDWNVIIYEKNNNVMAAMVYTIKNKFGIKYISIPKMTQYSGIWIDYKNITKNEKKLSLEEEVMSFFIKKLEGMKIDYYFQSLSPKVNNYLPFYWNDFKQTTKYTLVIKNNKEENIWNDMTSTLKNEIKKASKSAKLFYDIDSELFYKYLCKTFERQDDIPRLSFKEFKNMDEWLLKNKCRFVIGAKDENDNIHSICYFVYDQEKVYYLMSGNDFNYRKSNYNSLLIWEGIKFAIENNLDFDFEGSMNKQINSFMRKFGGSLVPYYCVSKIITKNPLKKLLIKFKVR